MGFTHLINRLPVDLDQIHRFTHEWERQARLQLRTGNPHALSQYEQQGRLHGSTTTEMGLEIIGGWAAAGQRRF